MTKPASAGATRPKSKTPTATTTTSNNKALDARRPASASASPWKPTSSQSAAAATRARPSSLSLNNTSNSSYTNAAGLGVVGPPEVPGWKLTRPTLGSGGTTGMDEDSEAELKRLFGAVDDADETSLLEERMRRCARSSLIAIFASPDRVALASALSRRTLSQ